MRRQRCAFIWREAARLAKGRFATPKPPCRWSPWHSLPLPHRPRFRGNLLKRVDELSRQSRSVPVQATPQARATSRLMYIVVPASLISAAAALLLVVVGLRNSESSASTAQSTAMLQRIDQLTAQIDQANEKLTALALAQSGGRPTPGIIPASLTQWTATPNLKTFDLAAMPTQPATARGRIFWDVDSNTWHFFATGMNPPPPGKVYELWFIASSGQMVKPAGSFVPSSSGLAALDALLPPGPHDLIDIAAVTDEPANSNMATPVGTAQLKGAMPSTRPGN